MFTIQFTLSMGVLRHMYRDVLILLLTIVTKKNHIYQAVPHKWTFWTQKVDFLNLSPHLYKTPFWHILWLSVDLVFGKFAVVHCRWLRVHNNIYTIFGILH